MLVPLTLSNVITLKFPNIEIEHGSAIVQASTNNLVEDEGVGSWGVQGIDKTHTKVSIASIPHEEMDVRICLNFDDICV